MNLFKTDKYIIKANVFRILSYLAVYGIFGVGNFLYFRSYIILFACILLALLPIISFFLLFFMSKYVSIKLYKSDEIIKSGSKIGIGLIVYNKSFLTSLNLKCYMTIKNDYYQESCEQIISVPVVAREVNKNPIICETSNCGVIEIALNKSEMYDVLGMFFTCYLTEDMLTINVLPNSKELDDVMRLGIIDGFAENEDDTKKGNEYSDVSNIREYIPGDRIKDIHWKLSSKRDILLVREHIKTCDNKLLVWIDRSPRKKNNELILAYTMSIINYCLSEGVFLKLLWLASDNSTLMQKNVLSLEDINSAFEMIFSDSSRINTESINSIIYSNNIKTNKLLRVGYKESEVTIYAYEV